MRSRSLITCIRNASVSASKNPQKIRNVGIVAHVDAGKTTVTERLLYLAGLTKNVGNVDSGDTVTDFLELEKERGITIQSASVAIAWKNHWINLIDTPGHVDFTMEVERCVRVLDGVVTVIDGSAGVQAQTLTVWRQASKYNLPATFFVNKLDKPGGSFERSIDSIQQKLGIQAIPTCIPLMENGRMGGVIDLIYGKFIDFSKTDTWIDIEKNTKSFEALSEGRSELCYSISDLDESFMVKFMDEHNGDHERIDRSMILKTLADLTHSRKAATVSCGSALRSSACTSSVLDTIVDFLPSPLEKHPKMASAFDNNFSGYIFKTTHDKRKGRMNFVRLYSGELKSGSSVYNVNCDRPEGPLTVHHATANELQKLAAGESVTSGNIAVITGLQHSSTGDTLFASKETSHLLYENVRKVDPKGFSDEGVNVDNEARTVEFTKVEAPESVYFCCIEPPSTRKMTEFWKALREIEKEDPSIRVREDRETGQTVVESQGELHMEVIKDRLVRGYGLDVFVGPLQIAYKEVLTKNVEQDTRVDGAPDDKSRTQFAQLSLKLEKAENPPSKVIVDLESGSIPPRFEWLKAINEGCQNALRNGPIASYPVQKMKITLTAITVSGGRINSALLSACAHKCTSEALSRAECILAEPVMKVEISVGNGTSTQPLLQELSKRRAQIQLCEKISDDLTVVIAQMPLAETTDLSRVIRTLTSGYGTFQLEIVGHQELSQYEQEMVLQRAKSF